MKSDKAHLNAFFYKHVFRNHLVSLKEGTSDDSYKKEMEIVSLGGNKKNILFLFNDTVNKFLKDGEMKFLSGLLTACNLSMEDIVVINFFNHQQTAYSEFVEKFRSKKILLFGLSASDIKLPFEMPDFQMQSFQQQVYLISPSIKKLQSNTDLKKQLWFCLQKVFNINSSK